MMCDVQPFTAQYQICCICVLALEMQVNAEESLRKGKG